MDLNERLITYFEFKNIKRSDLVKALGFSRQTIENIYNKRNSPSIAFLEKVFDLYNDINIEFLFTGKGNVVKQEKEVNVELKTDLERKNKMIDTLLVQIDMLQGKFEDTDSMPKAA